MSTKASNDIILQGSTADVSHILPVRLTSIRNTTADCLKNARETEKVMDNVGFGYFGVTNEPLFVFIQEVSLFMLTSGKIVEC